MGIAWLIQGIPVTPYQSGLLQIWYYAPRISYFEATTEPEESPKEKNPHAVALGRLGWLKGGKARAKKLTAEQRKEIARKAARSRWGKGKFII